MREVVVMVVEVVEGDPPMVRKKTKSKKFKGGPD